MIIIAAFFHISLVCVKPAGEVETVEEQDEEEIKQKHKLDV